MLKKARKVTGKMMSEKRDRELANARQNSAKCEVVSAKSFEVRSRQSEVRSRLKCEVVSAKCEVV